MRPPHPSIHPDQVSDVIAGLYAWQAKSGHKPWLSQDVASDPKIVALIGLDPDADFREIGTQLRELAKVCDRLEHRGKSRVGMWWRVTLG